jgi:hypothetical protein
MWMFWDAMKKPIVLSRAVPKMALLKQLPAALAFGKNQTGSG